MISYSSVDSFIKREYVLDILDKYKIHPKLIAFYQREGTYFDDLNSNYDGMSQTPRSGSRSQERREYYNDFEDCIRDFKNAKLKLTQKIHRSDGDNGDSDSEYLECCDSNDIKAQSSFSSKSMSHVNTTTATDISFIDSKLCQQMAADVKQNIPLSSASRRDDGGRVNRTHQNQQQQTSPITSRRIHAKSTERTNSEKVKVKRKQTDDDRNEKKNDTKIDCISSTTQNRLALTEQNTSRDRKVVTSQAERNSRKSISNDCHHTASPSMIVHPTSAASCSSGDEIKSSRSSMKRNLPARSSEVENHSSDVVVVKSEMSPVTKKSTAADNGATVISRMTFDGGQIERSRSESRKRSCKKRQAKLAIASSSHPSSCSGTTVTTTTTLTTTVSSAESKQQQKQTAEEEKLR